MLAVEVLWLYGDYIVYTMSHSLHQQALFEPSLGSHSGARPMASSLNHVRVVHQSQSFVGFANLGITRILIQASREVGMSRAVQSVAQPGQRAKYVGIGCCCCTPISPVCLVAPLVL